MPKYNYQCENCKFILEENRSVECRNNDTYCPVCGDLMQRLYENTISFILKGKGFYCNDYPKR